MTHQQPQAQQPQAQPTMISIKMKENKLKGYLDKALRNFAYSFKSLDRKILYVVVFNLVFYLVLLACYNSLSTAIMKQAEPVFAIAGADFKAGNDAALQANMEIIDTFYRNMASYMGGIIVLLLAVYGITNLLVWSTITGTRIKKAKKAFMAKFIALSALLAAAAIGLTMLVIWSVRTAVVPYWLLVLVILYIHLGTIAYISYFMKKKIGKSIKSAFSTGFARLHHFIVPYILVALVFIVLNYATAFISKGPLLGNMTFYFIVFIFFIAWFRIYVYSFAKDLV